MSTLASVASSIQTGWGHVIHDVSQWGNTLYSRVGPLEVAALVVATVAFLAWAITSLGGGTDRELKAALRPYRVKPRGFVEADDEKVLARSALKRISGLLSAFAEQRGFRDTLAARLQRAGLPIGVGEFMTICLVGAIIVLVMGFFVAGLMGIILALIISLLVPVAALQFLADRRKRQFAQQIPDVLKLLAASLRAGFSLLQGLDAILYQIQDPMAAELKRAFASTHLGTSVEDALEAAAERVGSQDFSWTVMAIRIQREVGGNLSEILETVAGTMTERVRLKREIRTLTAEGRLSAMIVAALPFALAAMIYVVNRPYIATLFHTFSGQMAILFGVVLEIAGVWWMYRIVQIEI